MSGQRVKIKRHGRKTKTIRNFEACYARLNLKRGSSRTVITILSLVMSITVFVALESFIALLDTGSAVQDMTLGDYAVTSGTVGMVPEGIAKIREHEMTEHLSTTKLSVYTRDENGEYPIALGFGLQAWEAFQVAGLDDTRLLSYIDDLSEQDKSDLLSGAACIVKNPIPFAYEGQTVEATDFGYGDILSCR